MRYCSEHDLLARRDVGRTNGGGLSGFGSTDSSTEHGPVSSRSAFSRVSALSSRVASLPGD